MNELVQRLTNAAASGDYKTLDDAWLELIEADPVPSDALEPLLVRLAEAGQGARALDLVLALAPELVAAERYAEALPLFRAVGLAAKPNEDVRAGLIDCYRHVYRRKRHAAACIDRSGILNAPDLAETVATLERTLSYEEGGYVFHPSGWGVGKITGFHPLDATAFIDFEHKPNHVVPLQTLETIFERLEPGDFRVLRTTDPEGLTRLAQDDPAAFVRKLLAARNGRATLRGLRDELQGSIVPKDGWTKWWTRARAALRRDPHVDVTAGANAVLSLREEALTHEDEMRDRFGRLIDLAHQTDLVRDYVSHMAQDADPEAFLRPAADAIAERLHDGDPPAERFEAALLLAELRLSAGEAPSPAEVLAEQADPMRLLNGLSNTAARRHAAELLRQSADNWRETCCDILLRGPAELWDTAVAGLEEGEGEPNVLTLVRELFANPKRNLDLFAWLGRNLLTGRLTCHLDNTQLFEAVLSEGDEVARRKALRAPTDGRFPQEETLANFRTALRAGNLGYFDEVMADASEGEAARLLFRLRQSRVLTDQTAHQLERKITRKFPKLLIVEDAQQQAAETAYIYATPAGIARRRAQHDHIMNVELPAIEKRIGAAAAMGDISDNADWRTAIEEREHLSRRVREMAAELQLARPIESTMVHTEHISIGSRITIENVGTGEQATYALLGLWDADAEHSIMSYTAPLARALMTRKLGEVIHFEHAGEAATYRILSVESAFEGRTINA